MVDLLSLILLELNVGRKRKFIEIQKDKIKLTETPNFQRILIANSVIIS